MAKQTLNNTESGLLIRTKINENFTELYDASTSVNQYGAVGDDSTNNNTFIDNAITAAIAGGFGLFWPAGIYVTTASIDDLHIVNHTGPGIIKRGSDTFYVAPILSQANSIYVSTAGTDANDGLSSSQPTKPQQAFDYLDNYGPVLDGQWIVEYAAGTYTYAFTGVNVAITNLKSKNRVNVCGPSVGASPAVPTAIFDGTGGVSGEHGMRFDGTGLRVLVQDMKFQNFTGSNGRIGLVGDNETDFYTINVHADNCDWTGIYASFTIRARISGGILNNCRSGFIANDTQCTFGYSDIEVLVTNCYQSGCYWSRGAQGHIDASTFEDNAVGIDLDQNCRAHIADNTLNRNNVGIRTRSGAVYFEDNSTFGTGGDANTRNIVYDAYSGETLELANAASEFRIANDRTQYIHSGTGATVISTPYTMPAYRLDGVAKTLRVKVWGFATQITSASTMIINFGSGMALSTTTPGTIANSSFELEGTLHEAQGAYRSFSKFELGLANQRLNNTGTGFDKTVSNAISLEANLSNAGDSITIYRIDVFITG